MASYLVFSPFLPFDFDISHIHTLEPFSLDSQERTRNAQFIIISLRNNMFELADRLVGIYKTNNSTKSVAINPKKIAMAAHKAVASAEVASAPAPLGLRNK